MERNRRAKRSTTVQVDSGKLIAELQRRNLRPVDASREIGFSSQYINNMLSDARRCGRPNILYMSKPAVNLLFEKFNIRTDSILWVEPQPEPEPAPEPQPGDAFTLNENTLYRIMYAAIVHGIRDCAPDIEKAVYKAVKVAWGE